MPTANNRGVKIYYEVEGEGPPLVFGHGAMGNISVWQGYGYVDRLKDKYKLILVDARGHGKSDKLYTHADYDVKFMADDVIAVLDDLGIEQTHYWGFSMGGYTGFGLAKYYPKRLLSLILGGASPYFEFDPTEPQPLRDAMYQGIAGDVEAMVETFRGWAGGTIHPTAEARLRSLDPRALAAFFEFSPDEKGIEDVLPTMFMPCLLYTGGQDYPEEVLTYAKQMPNATTFILPNLNHAQTSAAVHLLIPRALEFLATGK